MVCLRVPSDHDVLPVRWKCSFLELQFKNKSLQMQLSNNAVINYNGCMHSHLRTLPGILNDLRSMAFAPFKAGVTAFISGAVVK